MFIKEKIWAEKCRSRSGKRKEGRKNVAIMSTNYTASAVQEYLSSSPVLHHYRQSRKIIQTHYFKQLAGFKQVSAFRRTGWEGKFVPWVKRRVPVCMVQAPWHHPVGAHPKPGSISHCSTPGSSMNELLRGCILCLAVCSYAANV